MTDEQDAVGRLIRAAGRRSEPTPEALQRIHGVVHAEWQAGLRQHSLRRRVAIAASVLVVLTGGLFAGRALRPGPGSVVATLAEAGTSAHIDRGWRGWLRPRGAAGGLHAGDRLVTDAPASAALLRLADGRTTLRVAAGSRLAWSAPGRLRLLAGDIYVDTGQGGAGAAAPLTIEAAGARVEHVGTRFTTSVRSGTLDVAVRDGRVRISTDGGSAEFGRGERARVDAKGAIERASGSAAGEDWRWVDALAPRIAIEGRDLLTVLTALSREAGAELSFADEALAARVRTTVLHGAPVDLPPREAIDVILATTSFAIRADGAPDRLRLSLR